MLNKKERIRIYQNLGQKIEEIYEINKFICYNSMYTMSALKAVAFSQKSNGLKLIIYWSFCTKVNKNGSIGVCTTSVLEINQISLLECGVTFKPIVKVINCLFVIESFEVLCFICIHGCSLMSNSFPNWGKDK